MQENEPLWAATLQYLNPEQTIFDLELYANLAYSKCTGKFNQRPTKPSEDTSHDQLTAIAWLSPRYAQLVSDGFDIGIFYTNDYQQPWWARPFHPAHPIAYLGMTGSKWFWFWSPIWFITVLIAWITIYKERNGIKMLATDSKIYHWLQLDGMIRAGLRLKWFRWLLTWLLPKTHPQFKTIYDVIYWYHRKNSSYVSRSIIDALKGSTTERTPRMYPDPS